MDYIYEAPMSLAFLATIAYRQYLVYIYIIMGGILMEGIVWIIALIGGVYVFGMSTSPSGEIEKISDEKNIYGISEDLINILKQKKIFT